MSSALASGQDGHGNQPSPLQAWGGSSRDPPWSTHPRGWGLPGASVAPQHAAPCRTLTVGSHSVRARCKSCWMQVSLLSAEEEHC